MPETRFPLSGRTVGFQAGVGFGAAAAMVAVTVLFSWTALHGLLKIDAARERSAAVQNMAEELFSQVKDAESSARGYVLTGRENLLDAHAVAGPTATALLERLREEVRDPENRKRLDVLKLLTIERLKLIDHLIATRRLHGGRAALQLVPQGKSAMDRLRAEVERFQARQHLLVEERAHSTESAARWTMAGLAAGGVLSVLGLVYAARRIARKDAAIRALAAEQDAFFDLSIDLLSIASFDGYLTRLSPSWFEVLGWSEEELKLKPFLEFVYPEDQPRAAEVAGQLRQGAVTAGFECRFLCKGGGCRTLSWSVSTRDGNYYAVGRDVTVLKQVERLRAEAVQIKTDFINMASHELRTPMTAIKMALDIVQDKAVGEMNERQAEFLSTAKRNVDRLVRLINDVLDFQKMDVGRLEFDMRREDSAALLEEAAAIFRPVAESKGIALECTAPAGRFPVSCDRDRIVQVLVNFVSNALKFTEKGSIQLSASLEPDGVRLAVHDTGPGIASGDLERLFKSFAQLPAGRKAGGTGLGLSLAKRIAESHGGRVGVESKVGEGSTFFIVLPLQG